ncbi:MAG: hypothetical protein DI536_33185 [Archangium gephyra]|uniref:Uncharacterized protein n=1 Tax=Archangium gephyra TaxID=48 RepID=A0A2W5UP02_9BACT|nr:MAG: hypothetical protein DI536_33185 [Archangium gephyra]
MTKAMDTLRASSEPCGSGDHAPVSHASNAVVAVNSSSTLRSVTSFTRSTNGTASAHTSHDMPGCCQALA